MIAPEVLELLKKQVRILRSMDHSEHPISVCDKACEVAEAIETLISAYEQQAKVVEKLPKTADGVPLCNDMELWAYTHTYDKITPLRSIVDARAVFGEHELISLPAKCCYFTREAAIAATPAAESERGDE